MIKLKRVYDSPEKSDGYRILVDRLWPRGLSKEKTQVDEWIKDIAPTNALRTWFNHDLEKWTEFVKKYKAELESNKRLLIELQKLEKQHKTISLLFAAKDTEHNNAIVLQSVLKNDTPGTRNTD